MNETPPEVERRHARAHVATADQHYILSRRVTDLVDRIGTVEALTREVARANSELRDFVMDRFYQEKNALDEVKKNISIVVKWVNEHESRERQKEIARAVLTVTNIVLIFVVVVQMLTR